MPRPRQSSIDGAEVLVHLVERGAQVVGIDAEDRLEQVGVAADGTEVLQHRLEGGDQVAVGQLVVREHVVWLTPSRSRVAAAAQPDLPVAPLEQRDGLAVAEHVLRGRGIAETLSSCAGAAEIASP